MLSSTVSNATTMVKIGSSGGGVREHDKSSLLQVHSVAPDWILDGAAMQEAWSSEILLNIVKSWKIIKNHEKL